MAVHGDEENPGEGGPLNWNPLFEIEEEEEEELEQEEEVAQEFQEEEEEEEHFQEEEEEEEEEEHFQEEEEEEEPNPPPVQQVINIRPVLSPRLINPEKEIFYLIRQFLAEEGYDNTVHTLEMERSLYFDLGFFERNLLVGNFDASIHYLCGVVIYEHADTEWLVFQILKHKLLEAVDRGDLVYATTVLEKELNWVQPEKFDDLKSIVRPNYNFREQDDLSDYEYDVESMRLRLLRRIWEHQAITDHPRLKDKMLLPWVRSNHLRTIHYEVINRSEFQQAVKNELLYLIRQFLEEEQCNNTLHVLEREKSLYFDMNYFKNLTLAGEWQKAVQYIWPLDDKLVIQILKQDYLEAINRGDVTRGVLLLKSFKEKLEEEELKNLSVLLAYSNIREHPDFQDIDPDLVSMRQNLVTQLEIEISNHPLIKDQLAWIGRRNLRTIYQEYKLKAARRASI